MAYSFLLDEDTQPDSLTYGHLDWRARAIAAMLQRQAACGERVLLLYPPGLDYLAAFFGALYAGVVAVPLYPPRLNQSLSRIEAVILDARPALALTTDAILTRLEPLLKHATSLRSLRWLSTDHLADGIEREWRETLVDNEQLAFLQYTSGSTGQPKGVMLSHENLWHNSMLMEQAFHYGPQSMCVSWLPTYHDMGLIGGVLQPLYGGFPCVLMAPATFLKRPSRWLQTISRFKATISGGPNFAYELCARKIKPEEMATLDLSSWSVAFNGAEPLRQETLDQFATTFASCGFRRDSFFSCYGLAEATLMVSCGKADSQAAAIKLEAKALENNRVVPASVDDKDVRSLVSCGETLPGQQVFIIHPESLMRCAPDEVGEIWVAGRSVAAGYWNQAEETEQTFHARIQGAQPDHFLRTGDLGFLRGLELFVTGRYKDLIIIRGLNHYPQDIELTAEQSDASLRPGCGAAFAIEVEGVERLVVIHELNFRARPETNAVFENIRRAIAEEHELEVFTIILIKPGTIPKTSSGKIRRRACLENFLSGNLEIIARRDSALATTDPILGPLAQYPTSAEGITAWLVSWLASRLNLDSSRVDVDQPISRYGFDSLTAIELIHEMETTFDVVLPLVKLLQNPSIKMLAEEALSSAASSPPALNILEPAPQQLIAGHELSHGQTALWFLYQLSPESPAYNITRATRIAQKLDLTILRHSFQKLVNRHPALRTIFTGAGGAPRQIVREHASVDFEAIDASLYSEPLLKEMMEREAHAPFDLEKGPLLRVRVFSRTAEDHLLVLSIHHIVADLWSLAVLVHELGMLYEAERNDSQAALPELSLQYVDYVRWETNMLSGPEGERLWAYWRTQLAGELPVLNLQTDRRRPLVQTFGGSSQALCLGSELTRRLKDLCQSEGVTLYMLLLAAFQVLLHRYTGQDDLLVGSPAAGRPFAWLSGVVGYFVNPLVMRADFSGGPTFKLFLHQVRGTVLAALEHQRLPFALLVDRLQPTRDAGRSPLFQVMFVLQKAQHLNDEGVSAFALGAEGSRLSCGTLQLESVALEQEVAQFDLMLMMAEMDGQLGASLQYNTDLFEAASIARMLEHFVTLLEGILTNPEQRVSRLPLLTSVERARLLREWNETRADFPQDVCVHQLFEEQCQRTPDAIAVVFEDERLTYRELNRHANRVARSLMKHSVAPNMLVAILARRNPQLLIAMLAVFKAGGAYLPLDPLHPAQRLGQVVSQSEAALILVAQDLQDTALQALEGEWPREKPPIMEIERLLKQDQPADDLPARAAPHDLAYVIYTSGSTGKPKGAMVSHVGMNNHLAAKIGELKLTKDDNVAQTASQCFDISVWQFFAALVTGGRVQIISDEVAQRPRRLLEAVARENISIIETVPSLLRAMLEDVGRDAPAPLRLSSLRWMLVTGEALPPDICRQWLKLYPRVPMLNAYGPTECSDDVTHYRISVPPADHLTRIPVGRPIINTRLYILDEQLSPVPLGIAGELHVGGICVGYGYLNDAQRTVENFIPDPFIDEPGARLYKTGDLARYLPDGNIEFLGRLDNQIKLRGFRIELGEIEAALVEHSTVREAVVLLLEGNKGHQQLIAYLVQEQGQATQSAELRDFLKGRLPEYMVPAAFVLRSSLPLNANGKIDRRALAAMQGDAQMVEQSFTEPRNQIEETLRDMMAGVLHVERIGVHHNFFELGGNSLLAVQMMSRLREAFGVEAPLRTLFEKPTIAELAQFMEQFQREQRVESAPSIEAAPRGRGNLDRLLAELDLISEAEARTLLSKKGL
jgi:amino acid adenylation domain-containing protein